ncbi:MAG TPA: hypothetical protein VJ326_06860 [Thermoplasmata archaeon]|nr:hypothetical protein [Thermoplasmata archaeon]
MIARAQAAWEDPATRGRILRWAWLVSTAFTLLGFAVIAYLLVTP